MKFNYIKKEDRLNKESQSPLVFGLNSLVLEGAIYTKDGKKPGLEITFSKVNEKDKKTHIIIWKNIIDTQYSKAEDQKEQNYQYLITLIEALAGEDYATKFHNSLSEKDIKTYENLLEYTAKILNTFKDKKLTVYAHYQPSLKEGSNMTFLEIPTNLWSGEVFSNISPEGYIMKKTEEELVFINEQTKLLHPIMRKGKYMKNKGFFVQQFANKKVDNSKDLDIDFKEIDNSTDKSLSGLDLDF